MDMIQQAASIVGQSETPEEAARGIIELCNRTLQGRTGQLWLLDLLTGDFVPYASIHNGDSPRIAMSPHNH